MVTAAPKEVPPFVERLTTTARPPTDGLSSSPSDSISQTLWRASYATEGSEARSYAPPPRYLVSPERKLDVQLAPPFVEVAKPIPDAPPSANRPDWKAVTMV